MNNHNGGLNHHGLQHGMTNISGSGMTLGMTGGTLNINKATTLQTHHYFYLLLRCFLSRSLNSLTDPH